jgi:hypothetical protein
MTIEGEFKEQGSESALAVVPPKEVVLSSQDPTEFIERAVKQADALKGIIDKRNLAINIGGGSKKHVLIDGWMTLMALNGVMPYTVSVERVRDEEKKLTAYVTTEIRRVSDGFVLTSVASSCSQHEPRWAKAEEYAVVSMAQTRGVGKGCRQLFGWVMALAGYDATPADEMPEQPHGWNTGQPQTQPEKPANLPPPQKAATDASGVMNDEARKSVERARQHANSVGTTAAQIRLKGWGYANWKQFLAEGTALQADEIVGVLVPDPVTA